MVEVVGSGLTRYWWVLRVTMVEEVVGSGQMKESMMTIMVEEVGPRSGLMAELLVTNCLVAA